MVRIKLNNTNTALCPVPSSQWVLNSYSLIIIIIIMVNNRDDGSTNSLTHQPKILMLLTFLSCSYFHPGCIITFLIVIRLFRYSYFFIATYFTQTSNCLHFSWRCQRHALHIYSLQQTCLGGQYTREARKTPLLIGNISSINLPGEQ